MVIGGVTRAQTAYDLLGRISSYAEYDASGVAVHSRHDIVYDARGLVLAEKSSTRQGSDWLHSHTVNYYSATGAGVAGPAIGWAGQVGSASGSLLYYSETKNWKNGGAPVYGTPGNYSQADLDYADSYTSQAYGWRDGAQQSLVQLVNRDGTSTSSYSYDRDGALTGVAITGGARPRTILYRTDLEGQVLFRGESDLDWQNSDPITRTYRFGGRQMGVVSNDGTSNVDYAAAIAERTAAPGSGPFRGGASNGTIFADFDANFTALNGGTVGGATSYAASAGETLQSIAARLWGDANLWYKLAEANPGMGAGALATGTMLAVPGGVVGSRHDATSFKPYDPAEAIGNTSPNTPKPPRKDNCGTLGVILVAVVAIAITLVIKAPVAKLFTGLFGAVGAPAGSAAAIGAGIATASTVGAVASAGSQLYGMAIGVQDRFSWKGVALAGISAGVAKGLAYVPGLGEIAGSAVLGDVARGALGNAVTQGIGVATRLQSKFDFAGVAAAGMGALAGGTFGGAGLAGQVGGITADALASAATRSVLTGTDFGDNILAVLPDVIARTLGAVAEEAIQAGGIASATAASLTHEGAGHGAASETPWLNAGLRNGIRADGVRLVGQLRDEQLALVAADTQRIGSAREAAIVSGIGEDGTNGEIVVTASRAALARARRERMDEQTVSGLPRLPTEVGPPTLSQMVLDIQRTSYLASWNASLGKYDPGYHAEVMRAFDYAQLRIDAYNGLANAAELELAQALGNGLWEFGKLTPVGGGIDLTIRAYNGELTSMDAVAALPLVGKAATLGRISEMAARARAADSVPEGFTRAYRAVSHAEFDDIVATGRFNQGPNSLEGKWFADRYDDVLKHGDGLEGPGNYRVIEADLPDNAPSLYRVPNLDGRGPARFLHMDDLQGVTPRPYKPR